MSYSKSDWIVVALILTILPLFAASALVLGDLKRNNDQILIQNTDQDLNGFGTRFEVSIPVTGSVSEAPVKEYKIPLYLTDIKTKYLDKYAVEVFLVVLGILNGCVLYFLSRKKKVKIIDITKE